MKTWQKNEKINPPDGQQNIENDPTEKKGLGKAAKRRYETYHIPGRDNFQNYNNAD